MLTWVGNKPGIAADSSCPTSRGSPPAGKMFSAEQNSSPFVVVSPDLDLRLHDPFCALCLQLVLPSCLKGKEPAGVRLKPSPAPGPEAEQIPEIVFPAWFCKDPSPGAPRAQLFHPWMGTWKRGGVQASPGFAETFFGSSEV